MRFRIHGGTAPRRAGVAAGAALALVLAPGRAAAALGEQAGSVARDRAALSAGDAGARALPGGPPGCAVRELRTGSAAVREFLSPEGVVFAVAWEGLAPPDLGPLLGAYAGEVRAAEERTPRSGARARREVRSRSVVVERWGHMRHLQGRAYLPALLPAGVPVDAIR